MAEIGLLVHSGSGRPADRDDQEVNTRRFFWKCLMQETAIQSCNSQVQVLLRFSSGSLLVLLWFSSGSRLVLLWSSSGSQPEASLVTVEDQAEH